ncbi:MAG: hypothetical protein AB1793_08575 [Candidatus Thermoplasmatota archaeon]
MELARKGSALFLMALSALMLVPSAVSANISIEPRLEDPFTGIVTLIAMNFGWDLFLMALAVYVAMRLRDGRIGDAPLDPGTFVGLIVLAGAAVAVAGGFIDFAFLYERAEDHYTLREFSIEMYSFAALLIFATIVAALLLIVRVDWKVAVAAGAAIAPLSPLAWGLMSLMSGTHVVLPFYVAIILSAAFVVALLVLLHGFRSRVSSGELYMAYEGAGP